MPERRFEDKLKDLLHLHQRNKDRRRSEMDGALIAPPPPPLTAATLVSDEYEQMNYEPDQAGGADPVLANQPIHYQNPFNGEDQQQHLQQPSQQQQHRYASQRQQLEELDPQQRMVRHGQELQPVYHEGGRGGEESHFPVTEPLNNVVDPQLMQQPSYDDNNIQILNDTAADESLPVLNYYISQLSHLGDKAQGRLIARAASFQSKNQVFSNIVDTRDYQMAQDDFQYAQILSKSDFTAFDMNADYFTAEAIMEAMFNIRLRRSRRALNLSMFNTQRQENIMGGGQQHHEENQKIWQKVPFLGGGGGGGGGRY